MPDYSHGRIYAIRAPGTDEIYIGSTCESLSKRFAKHKYGYKNWNGDRAFYVSSFELMKKDGVYIELIENYPCANKEELNRREGEIIRESVNCINKNIPGQSEKERRAKYRDKNRDKINKQSREWKAAKRAAINSYEVTDETHSEQRPVDGESSN